MSLTVSNFINKINPTPPPLTCTWRRNPNRRWCGHFSTARSSLFIQTPAPQRLDEDDESISRRLILLRHAQSSWDNPSLRGSITILALPLTPPLQYFYWSLLAADHDRPLSKAGQSDASKVSLKLHQLGWIPQLILSRWVPLSLYFPNNEEFTFLFFFFDKIPVCSDAVRTRQTLEIMLQQVPALLDAEIHFISSFYSIAAMDGQTADHLQQAICKYSRDDILTVMSVVSVPLFSFPF